MRPAPRPAGPPPRLLGVTGLVLTISAAALVVVPDSRTDTGLSPRTVAAYVADAAPAGATDVRINNVYGSGHGGTWQFVASLTWRDANGHVVAGSTTLPQNAGQPTIPVNLAPNRVAREHAHGWTAQAVRRAFSRTTHLDATLAMVELAITDAGVTLVTCHAASEGGAAQCAHLSSDGRVRERFDDRLHDVHGLDAVSVQRASAPIVP